MEELIKYYKENISEYTGKENMLVPIDILSETINEYYNENLSMTEEVIQFCNYLESIFPDLEDERGG